MTATPVRRGRPCAPISMVVLSCALVAVACGGGEPGAPADLSPELRQGRAIYGDRCAVCHGRSGGGGMGPALSGGQVVERYPDIDDHIAVVRDGRGRMPAWGERLTAEEIEAVVRYEREAL